MEITIYGLKKPNGPIRYVGKTSRSLKLRLAEHVRHAHNPMRDCHRYKWIRKLDRQGQMPEIVALEIVDIDKWETAEQEWIERLMAEGHNLVNGDISGTGLFTGDWGVKGEDHYLSKLTEDDVIEVCELYATGKYTQDELAEIYEISSSNVHQIIRGKSWKHVQRPIVSSDARERRRKVSDEDVVEISKAYATGSYTMGELAKRYGVSYQLIHLLVTGKKRPYLKRPITHAADGDIEIKHLVKPGPKIGLRGEQGPNSTLTKEQVKEIRRLYATGKYSQREIGEMFGVVQQNVSNVVRRQTWIE